MPGAVVEFDLSERPEFRGSDALNSDQEAAWGWWSGDGGLQSEGSVEKFDGEEAQPNRDGDRRKDDDAEGDAGAGAGGPIDIVAEKANGNGAENGEHAKGAEDAAGHKGLQHDEQKTE